MLILFGIIWIFVQVFMYFFASSAAPSKEKIQPLVMLKKDYVEKIDNFSLQHFDSEHKLLHLIEAKHYFSRKNAPDLLLNPKVSVYDKNGVQSYYLSAKRANYLDNAQVEFTGKVNIHSKIGVTHIIDAKSLLVNMQTNDLNTQQPITYSNAHIKIAAQGIQVQSTSEEIKFTGNVKILQSSGTQITTKDLHINQSGGQNIYQTKHDINYKSKVANISAKAMDYDVKRQKIKLTGSVFGRYQ